MIRVLIAEDSPTVAELLVAILQEDPEIEVVGIAKDGATAVHLAGVLRPDVITMDIKMPCMNGFEATKEIMIQTPTPIIVVSGHVDVREASVAMHAMSAGALTVLPKPKGPMDPGFDGERRSFVSTVKALSQVRVVRRWKEKKSPSSPSDRRARTRAATGAATSRRVVRARVVAIAASAGGPQALGRILSQVPRDLPAPILLVQHIGRGFTQSLAIWLAREAQIRVKVAEQDEAIEPATVYIAPDDQHLCVTETSCVALCDSPPRKGFRPSCSVLFESVARRFGKAALAVVLTGMGNDGVEGLRDIRAFGGQTVAQDEATSAVFGMPAAAIHAGLADHVLPIDAMASHFIEATGPQNRGDVA